MELIRTEMTPKERMTKYMAGEKVDRIPTILSSGETSPINYGIQNKDYYFDSDLMVEVESRIAEDYGADNMGMGIGLRGIAEALGVPLAFPLNNVSHVDGPAITSYDELDGRKIVDIHKDGRLPILLEAFKKLQDKWGDTYIIDTGLGSCFTLAAFLVGTEKFLKDMIKRPEETEKLLQYANDNIVACCEQLYKETGIISSLAEPIIARNLLSPRLFKKYAVPYMGQLVKRLTDVYGEAPSLHVCGSTADRWEDFVNWGISAFSVDNCENMEDLKNQYGDKIAVVGNIDPVDLLRNGTTDDMKREVIRCLKEAGDTPKGFILMPGCTTPIGTPKDNVVAIMNYAAIYGKGAQKGKMPEGLAKVM